MSALKVLAAKITDLLQLPHRIYCRVMVELEDEIPSGEER